jgi:hypothetical protein
MLFWVYIAIAAFISVILLIQLWKEEDWRAQVAIAMTLIVCVLRVLRTK